MKVSVEQLHRGVTRLLVHAGADAREAHDVAEHLVWCEAAGRGTHGVGRVPVLVRRLEAGLFASPCTVSTERLGPSLVSMDGGNGLGPIVAARAMDEAVARARDTGLGVVFVRRSNWFGAGAPIVERAARLGLVGFAASNSVPKVAPPGGVEPVLGTNPIALGVPRRGSGSVLVDLATSAVAGSVVRREAERGGRLPEGVALDGSGRPTTDPSAALAGALRSIGGDRGFGLSLAVEILAGVVSGAGVAHGVGSLYADFDRTGGNGHCVAALDVGRLMPLDRFHDRMEELVAALEAAGGPGASVVRIPGDRRWEALQRATAEGVALAPETAAALRALGAFPDGEA